MTYTLKKEDGDKLLKEDGGFKLLETLKQIEDFQANWITTHSRYLQIPQTHTVPPSTPTAPDNINTKVMDVAWSDTDMVVGDQDYSIEIIEYLVPPEKEVNGSRVGYEVVLKRTIGDTVYARNVGYGPEAEQRTSLDWYEVITR